MQRAVIDDVAVLRIEGVPVAFPTGWDRRADRRILAA